jgi:hypothetical protein
MESRGTLARKMVSKNSFDGLSRMPKRYRFWSMTSENDDMKSGTVTIILTRWAWRASIPFWIGGASAKPAANSTE